MTSTAVQEFSFKILQILGPDSLAQTFQNALLIQVLNKVVLAEPNP